MKPAEVWQAIAANQFKAAEEGCLAVLERQPDEPQALMLLGVVQFRSGRKDEGVALLERVIRQVPDFAAAHFQLGSALKEQRDLKRAEHELRQAVELNPELMGAHAILADLLIESDRFAEAIVHYRKALHLADANPGKGDVPSIMNRLAAALQADGQPQAAIDILQQVGTPAARARLLTCLLDLKSYDEFFEQLLRDRDSDADNIGSAAVSAYAAQQLGRPDPHPFCPDPMSRMRIIENFGLDDAAECTALIAELVDAYHQREKIYEPAGRATTKGYQTPYNQLADTDGPLARLRELIVAQIKRYRDEVDLESTVMGERWPAEISLHGWYVGLPTGGFEDPHIHPNGWLSGVVYLQMPQTISAPGEGAIEFTLRGPGFPPIGADCPTYLHEPVPGQMLLFPSSLYHRTLPFSSDELRISLAFDLNPPR